jgi:hypothetical protein
LDLDTAFFLTSQARLPSTISLLLGFLAAAVPAVASFESRGAGSPSRKAFRLLALGPAFQLKSTTAGFSFWFFLVRLRFSFLEASPDTAIEA